MNRLKKELIKRDLIGDNELDVLTGKTDIECTKNYVGLQNDLIIITYCCDVLDPMFFIYDKNFNRIAEQCIWLNNMTHCNPDGKKNPWDVWVY